MGRKKKSTLKYKTGDKLYYLEMLNVLEKTDVIMSFRVNKVVVVSCDEGDHSAEEPNAYTVRHSNDGSSKMVAWEDELFDEEAFRKKMDKHIDIFLGSKMRREYW